MYAPVVEDFGGWYLRGDIGFSNQSIKKLDWFSYPTLTSLNQTTGFDTGGIFGIGFGYQFNNWFRADITGQFRGRSNFHGTDLFVFSNAGLFTPYNTPINTSNIYTIVGAGLRTRNESLVFGTLELRGYYFLKKNIHNENWRIDISTNITFKYNNQLIKKPDFIDVN